MLIEHAKGFNMLMIQCATTCIIPSLMLFEWLVGNISMIIEALNNIVTLCQHMKYGVMFETLACLRYMLWVVF